MHVLPPYSAYLRVYEPLAAFAEPERTRLGELAGAGRLDPRGAITAEHYAGLRALLGHAPKLLPAADGLEVLALRDDGVLRVCPLRVRLRSGLALRAFVAAVPGEAAGAFAPDVVLERVDDELVAFEREYGGLRPHVLSETWQVPPWWFVAFEPAERVLVLTPGSRSLRYRTAMSRARRRVARALDTLRRAVDGSVIDRVEELGRWLEEFHPHAVLELDYGGLVELWPDEALRGDTSVADVQDALYGLGHGEPDVARAAYERLSGRWRRTAERASAS